MAELVINQTDARVQYSASAGETSFTYDFPIYAATDLKVYKVASGSTAPDDAAALLTHVSDYSVTGAGTQAGGTVVLTSGATAGDIVTIERSLPYERTNDYQNAGDLRAVSLNADFDKLAMMTQQNRRDVDRALLISRSMSEGTAPFDASDRRIADMADPVQNSDATNRGWVESYVAGMLSGASGISGQVWSIDSGATTVALSGATTTVAAAYQVILGGVPQRPTTDYTLDFSGDTPQLTLTSAAPAAGWVVDLGYLRTVNEPAADSVTAAKLISTDAGLQAITKKLQFLRDAAGAVATTLYRWLNWRAPTIFEFMTEAQIADVQAKTRAVDVTAAVQAAIDAGEGRTIRFPKGDYFFAAASGGLDFGTVDRDLMLLADRGAKLVFEDGAYVGLHFSNNNAGNNHVRGFRIYGTNTTAPTITLVMGDGNNPNVLLADNEFAYGDIAVLMRNAYGWRVENNRFAACNVYFKTDNSYGDNTDVIVRGNTFGTTTIGTDPCVYLDSDYISFTDNYFETTVKTKLSLQVQGGSGQVSNNRFSNSGGIAIAVYGNFDISHNWFGNDSYYSTGGYVINAASAANNLCNIIGNQIYFGAVIAGVTAIRHASRGNVTANLVNKAAVGIYSTEGNVTGNSVLNCTTGYSFDASSTGVVVGENYQDNCTTPYSYSGAVFKAPWAPGGFSFEGATASTDAYTLDAYREGTFTPVALGSTAAGTGTYSTQVGRYTRIGNMCFFRIDLNWSAHTGTGDLRIGGLPFTAASAMNQPVTIVQQNLSYTTGQELRAYVQLSNDYLVLFSEANGAGWTTVAMDTAARVFITGCYEVA